ncbi:MAG TPA: hypothetical protein VGA03_09635 [Anaerolineales bacterium]
MTNWIAWPNSMTMKANHFSAEPGYHRVILHGTFTRQRGRVERCSLTEIGVLYWRYVPQLLEWSNEVDLNPCPLNQNYQLVRNILAVGVRPNGKVSPDNGHVVLIYDERNDEYSSLWAAGEIVLLGCNNIRRASGLRLAA